MGAVLYDTTRLKNMSVEARSREGADEIVKEMLGRSVAEEAVGRNLDFEEEILPGIKRREANMSPNLSDYGNGSYTFRTTVDSSFIDDNPSGILKDAIKLLSIEGNRRLRRESYIYLDMGEGERAYVAHPIPHSIRSRWAISLFKPEEPAIRKEGEALMRVKHSPFLEVCVGVVEGTSNSNLFRKAAKISESMAEKLRDKYERPNLESLRR